MSDGTRGGGGTTAGVVGTVMAARAGATCAAIVPKKTATATEVATGSKGSDVSCGGGVGCMLSVGDDVGEGAAGTQ